MIPSASSSRDREQSRLSREFFLSQMSRPACCTAGQTYLSDGANSEPQRATAPLPAGTAQTSIHFPYSTLSLNLPLILSCKPTP
ncbi:MAG: hypothetical protein IPK61_13505 [Saprospiraceae bacterium]|nr:hypothetical protein [Saprospiraceae bacterium]